MRAEGGGQVNLPSLNAIQDGHVVVESDGFGSVVDLPKISALAGRKEDFSQVEPDYGKSTTLRLKNFGTINISELSEFTWGAVEVVGQSVEFPNLTDVDNTSFVLSAGAEFALPKRVSSYEYRNVFKWASALVAEGFGTNLDFSSLIEFEGNDGDLYYAEIISRLGGNVDLSGLKRFTGGRTRVSAVDFGSHIDLFGMQLVNNSIEFISAEVGGGRISWAQGGGVVIGVSDGSLIAESSLENDLQISVYASSDLVTWIRLGPFSRTFEGRVPLIEGDAQLHPIRFYSIW